MKKVPKGGKKSVTCEGTRKNESGNSYPLDVWHLIARHIQPEDVAIFAAICQDASSVINSPSFWKNLYNKLVIEIHLFNICTFCTMNSDIRKEIKRHKLYIIVYKNEK